LLTNTERQTAAVHVCFVFASQHQLLCPIGLFVDSFKLIPLSTKNKNKLAEATKEGEKKIKIFPNADKQTSFSPPTSFSLIECALALCQHIQA
jgi:hypothetical protein